MEEIPNLNEYIIFGKSIAKKSGEVLKKYWGHLSDITEKKYSGDLVTEADKESEKIILSEIHNNYSSHNILSEEAGSQIRDKNSKYTWVVDPLDGTTNYTHQYPFVSISIALLYLNKPILGIVYNPILEEFFHGADKRGAFLNDTPIHVSKVTSLNYSLLATGFPYNRRENTDNNYSEFCRLTNECQGVRRGGSAALDLAYVAAGRLDGYWEHGLNPWDIAAGILLVNEAGGHVSAYDGTDLILESGRVVSSNALIHDELISRLSVKNYPQ